MPEEAEQMPNDEPDDRAERLVAILCNLIRVAHSFVEHTKQDAIASTDDWRELARAKDEAATDLSGLRSGVPR
jgi:hypothetical protein